MASVHFRQFLTVDQVAARLQVNPQTVRNWIDAGELPALRIGSRRVRVQKPALDAFIGLRSAVGAVASIASKRGSARDFAVES
jgi:excisionase family DNA binding protein